MGLTTCNILHSGSKSESNLLLYMHVIFCLLLLVFSFSYAADNASIEAARYECLNLLPSPDRNCFIRREHKILKEDEELKAIQQQVFHFSQKHFRHTKSRENDIYIYLHAHTRSAASPAGVVVLDKVLNAMRAYGLMQAATTVYVCLYGSNVLTEDILRSYGNFNKLIILRGIDKYSSFYEFPTLTLMYHHAKRYHPSSKILYLHTKGVTSPNDESRSYWRDTMLLWHVQFWSYSVKRLSKGWVTTGVRFKDFPWPHYSGNFFWVRADFLTQAIPPERLLWYWRFGAERWLLADRSNLTRVCKVGEIRKEYPLPSLGDSIYKFFDVTNCSISMKWH